MTDIPEGWIAHDGGPCPVDLQAKVEVMFRTGEKRYKRRAQWWTAFNTVSKFAEHDLWQWQAPNHANDIVAYKPESEAVRAAPLLEAIGELALAIAPHHMEIAQRQRIAAAMGTLIDHIIALAATGHSIVKDRT